MPEQTTPQAKPKGKVRRVLGWSFSPFVNVFGWLGLSSLTRGARDIKDMGTEFLSVQKETHKETFEQAVERLGISETKLLQEERIFIKLSIIFLCLGLMILLYSVYLAWAGWFISFVIAVIVSGIAFAYAFRFHFWWFQVRHHKLGCTFKEWYESEVSSAPNKGRRP